MESVEPIKGAQVTFLSFLWKQLADIRELQKKGYFQEGLIQALDLVDYLPEQFQNEFEFQNKAQKIRNDINQIYMDAEGVDIYTQMTDSLRALDAYAEPVLKRFMSELCVKLDAKGYMEKRPTKVERGSE